MEKESKVCCMSMIPSGYSIRERVEPIEKNDVIGYDDMQGNSYVGIKPDFEKEGWVNDLIEQVGLEELCKEFPYVHLKVDKKTRLLVPVDGKSQYAKITNLFHILYHMRKDEELKKQQQQQTVVQPVFVPQYSQNNGICQSSWNPVNPQIIYRIPRHSKNNSSGRQESQKSYPRYL